MLSKQEGQILLAEVLWIIDDAYMVQDQISHVATFFLKNLQKNYRLLLSAYFKSRGLK